MGNLLIPFTSSLIARHIVESAAMTARQQPDLAAIRRDGVTKRVQNEEWTGSSVVDLSLKAAKLACEQTYNPADPKFAELLSSIYMYCDQVSVASEVALRAVNASDMDRADWNNEQRQMENITAEERKQVMALRDELKRESMLANRRRQYEVMADSVLREPTIEESESKIKEMEKELKAVSKKVEDIQRLKQSMTMEVALFMHCVTELQTFNSEFEKLCPAKEEGEKDEDEDAGLDNADVMDTSI